MELKILTFASYYEKFFYHFKSVSAPLIQLLVEPKLKKHYSTAETEFALVLPS
jgi:hypothetical protein